MTKRMRASLTGMLNEIDETLLKMAQNRSGFLDESACYEAVREIRLKRIEIQLRFERRFINLFENEIRIPGMFDQSEKPGHMETQGQSEFKKLSKEDSLSMENSVGAIRKSCGQTLLDLDKKMGLLIDLPEHVNPVQPEIVFEAFREACWDIKSGDEVRMLMFSIFERRITAELRAIYQDINKLLEKQDGSMDSSSKIDFNRLPKQQQQMVMVRYEVISRIEKRLEGHEVPDFVRAFLLGHWCVFLEKIFIQYTENSIAWNAARQTMDDLIWSVSRISTDYDRRRLVQLLPSLLFRLINGMKVISMKDVKVEQFLKELKGHQLRSLDQHDSQLLQAIADEAIESVSSGSRKTYH